MLTQVPCLKQFNSNALILQQQFLSSKSNKKVSSLNSILIHSLFQQIQAQKLKISKSQKPFKLEIHEGSGQKINLQMSKVHLQKSDLIQKKQTIQNELKKIQLQEYKLHINQSRYGLNQSKISQGTVNNASERMFRSELTEQQKQKIKQVLKNQKKFIKQLKKKQKIYYTQLEEDRKQKIQIQQNIKKQNCQQRKIYWNKIKDQITKRSQQRKIKFIEEQQRLKEVKKSKKLYKVLQNSWNNKVNNNQQAIKQATQHMRKNHKFQLSKIIQHQRQYQKIAKQKQQSRQKNFQQFKQKVKSTLPKIPTSKFFQKVKQQQRLKQQQQLNKQKRKLQLSQRKAYFNQKVKQHYKPKIDQSLKNQILLSSQQQKIQKKPAGLPFKQVINLGNQYMRQIHKNVALVKINKGEDIKINEQTQNKKPLYKNYLADLKQKRNSQEVKLSLTNQVTKIMKNTSYSTVQKIQRAKLVAKRLESKQNQKSTALISSINQKMKILRVLNNE